MTRFLFQRLVLLVPTVLGVLTLVFVLVRLLPGDVALVILGENATAENAAILRARLGLDVPIYVQYVTFLADAVRGDLGRSLLSNRSVMEEITTNLPYTLQLAAAATVLSVLVGLPVGIYSAVRRNSPGDHLVMLGAIIGAAAPEFVIGIIAILIFAVRLGWFPIVGAAAVSATAGLGFLILPATVLGFSMAGLVARMTRSSLLEVLGMDYVRTARAKGLSERVTLVRHALRNALVPIVTTIGHNVGRLVGGTAILEVVFVRPGLGLLMVQSVFARDYPITQAVIIYYAFMVVFANLLVDVSYTWLDPRVRYE